MYVRGAIVIVVLFVLVHLENHASLAGKSVCSLRSPRLCVICLSISHLAAKFVYLKSMSLCLCELKASVFGVEITRFTVDRCMGCCSVVICSRQR